MKNEQLVSKDFFTTLPFWGKLERTEQSTVEKETRGLAMASAGEVIMHTEKGEHLFNLQQVLEGKGYFTQYLAHVFPDTSPQAAIRKGYRYIEAYKAVRGVIPSQVLKLAAARGISLVGYSGDRPFGRYTEPIKLLPPPAEMEKVPAWLDEIEEKSKTMPRRAQRVRHVSAEDATKTVYRTVAIQFHRIPAGKARVAAAKRLLGILMTELGLPAQTIEPEAIPEGFKAVVGRPRKG